MRLYIGTSGYSYKPWKRKFYPADLPAKGMLGFYARHFPAVEINSSYYRVPATKTLSSWAEQVPAEFRFSFKAPGRITHQQRLRGTEDATRYFLDAVRSIGARCGPLLFQLPPTFARDDARLTQFLPTLPSDAASTFEFRHASWYDDAVYAPLRAANRAICITDTDEQGASPWVATADWGYLRLRRADYTDDALAEWLARIRAQAWREAYIFFKHEDEARGPQYAQRLKAIAGIEPGS